jgi:hypothetical protein
MHGVGHRKEEVGMFEDGTKDSTKIGYVNRNQQKCCGHRHVPGTDHGAISYKMQCLEPGCGKEYGSNGTDVFQRKCPRCQSGKPGIPF